MRFPTKVEVDSVTEVGFDSKEVATAVMLMDPLNAGFQLHVATKFTVGTLMQPAMRFPLAKKVTFAPILVVAVIVDVDR